jgi:uncharacterized protein (DUF2141 family)
MQSTPGRLTLAGCTSLRVSCVSSQAGRLERWGGAKCRSSEGAVAPAHIPTESPSMTNLILSLAALTALGAHAADLRIEVSLPAQRQGTVLAALFDQSEGFPRGKPLQTATAPSVDGKAVVQFVGLPEGDYAVSAFLDENGNMKLDTNVFGVPSELYGFSRNARGPIGPPVFSEAAFRVGTDAGNQAIDLK